MLVTCGFLDAVSARTLSVSRVGAVGLVGAVLMIGAAMFAASIAQAQQQRDPAYVAARASGQIGEKVDGYLGVVGAPTANLRRLVDDLNLKRKNIYFEQAQEERVTPVEYAFATACKLIGRTVPGEKYQAPDGTWRTRTAAPPILHSKCP